MVILGSAPNVSVEPSWYAILFTSTKFIEYIGPSVIFLNLIRDGVTSETNTFICAPFFNVITSCALTQKLPKKNKAKVIIDFIRFGF